MLSLNLKRGNNPKYFVADSEFFMACRSIWQYFLKSFLCQFFSFKAKVMKSLDEQDVQFVHDESE